MKPEKSFEDYLKSLHAKDYHGTDDNMPDDFEHWLEDAQGYWIELSDNYAKTIRDFYQSEITKESL
jgi:hypothetical protein